ncbi:MAG: hypothetical protein GC157_08835 [Frankiales bacterium]|nr:hypothetical protein [Frankiales bacterium]
MRPRRGGWIAALAGALLLPVLQAPAAGTEPVGPSVTSVTFTGQHHYDLTGMQVGQVVVDVHIVSPFPVVPVNAGEYSEELTSPYLRLGDGRLQNLYQVGGSPTDGDWRSTFYVTANDDGLRTEVTDLVVIEGSWFQGTQYTLDLRGLADTSIGVRGRDRPVLLVSTVPATVADSWTGRVTATVTAMLQQSRTLLVGVPVVFCHDSGCDQGLLGPRLTDSKGRATYSYTSYPEARGSTTATLYRHNVHGRYADGVQWTRTRLDPATRTWVTASASPTLLRLGATTTLSGKARHASVLLVQRWVSGAWSTLGQVVPRVSGRWDYTTRPHLRGTLAYRALLPSWGDRSSDTPCQPSGLSCLYRGSVSSTVRVTVA